MINQIRINLECRGDKNNNPVPVLEVKLENSMPNLKEILIKVDDRNWKKSQENFLWHLHHGENSIWAKPVNKWKREGIVSSITVLYRR